MAGSKQACRSVGPRVLLAVLAVAAVSCSSGGVSTSTDSTSTDSTASGPSSTAPVDGLDGEYSLTTVSTCGMDQVTRTGRETLTVRDGRATVTFPISGTFEGPIVSDGASFTFDVTQADQYTAVHLEGTISEGGKVITGTGSHGQGTRPSQCNLTFTGQRTPTGPDSSTSTTGVPASAAPCTREAIEAGMAAAGALDAETSLYDFRCDGPWAALAISHDPTDGTDPWETSGFMHWDGSAWVPGDCQRPDAATVPTLIYQGGCMSN
jgi:hypothetical protein